MADERAVDGGAASEPMRSLEERSAFQEHALDQLSGELVRAFDRIQSLEGKIARLEARLATLHDNAVEEGGGDPLSEQPPHWGRIPGGE